MFCSRLVDWINRFSLKKTSTTMYTSDFGLGRPRFFRELVNLATERLCSELLLDPSLVLEESLMV
jgi:hypothetical protein